MLNNVAVIGAGQAAAEFVWAMRQAGFEGNLVLIGREPHVPYERPPLSKRALLEDGDCLERITPRGATAYKTAEIDLRTDCDVLRISPRDRQLLLSDGNHVVFDACVLATGATPRLPMFPGVSLDGVHVLRTYSDAVRLRERLVPGARLAVIGAGYLGLEVAASARMRGCEVSVVESAPRIMWRSASKALSAHLMNRHCDEGVRFYLDDAVASINGPDRVELVTLRSGRTITADAVLIAIGATPEAILAQQAGIACSGGVIVDARSRTSCDAVYAIGDCSTQHHPLYPRRAIRPESVQSALYQARCAAADLIGKPPPALKYPTFWSNQYDLKVQIAGLIDPNQSTQDIVDTGGGRNLTVWRYQDGLLAAVECVNAPLPYIRSQTELGIKMLNETLEGQACQS